jgi:endonuclease V-like protein UPF0215 family
LKSSFTVTGVQDGSFESFYRRSNKKQYTVLCCATLENTRILDITLGQIIVDGLDSTEVLLKNLKHKVDAIILGGATFGGFNVVDGEYIYKKTGMPLIIYSKDYPNIEATKRALCKHFSDWQLRWRRYESLGSIHSFKSASYSQIYYENIGCSTEYSEKILKNQTISCRIPEAVRVADIIAKGVSSIFQNRLEYFDESLD